MWWGWGLRLQPPGSGLSLLYFPWLNWFSLQTGSRKAIGETEAIRAKLSLCQPVRGPHCAPSPSQGQRRGPTCPAPSLHPRGAQAQRGPETHTVTEQGWSQTLHCDPHP